MISWVSSYMCMWIFYILSFLTIYFGIWTVMSKNPISSVVNLVGTFVSCACIFITLEIKLLGLIYIIVYVGAIAILFIFVIMMMDIRNITDQINFYKLSSIVNIKKAKMLELQESQYWHIVNSSGLFLTFMVLIGSGLGIWFIIYFMTSILYQDYFSIWEIAQRNIWESLLISLDLIHSIGYILYTDLLSLLLLVSLILLMIMIGVIVLIENDKM